MVERSGRETFSSRWRGQRGRLEVWYATVSDPRTRIGVWIHHEMVAPVAGEPFVHGWAAAFGPAESPVVERFGPGPVPAHRRDQDTERLGPQAFSPQGFVLDVGSLEGRSGRLAWDLNREQPSADGSALYTFPRWAWDRELLPAAQVVCVPSSVFGGSIEVDGKRLDLSPAARGGVAHIYGHGNAERWGWLHAELGAGDVLEIVSAVSRRGPLNRLRPLAFVQLRLGGHDWPRDPLMAAPLFRTELGLPMWQLSGTIGSYRLRVDVEIDPSRSVTLGYTDPDGSTATCTNSEMADARILLERRHSTWETVSSWDLRASAHSEVGTRP